MSTGPIFFLFFRVSSDYAQPITGQVTEVTCPVIGRAQHELTPSKRQKTGPGDAAVTMKLVVAQEIHSLTWTDKLYSLTAMRTKYSIFYDYNMAALQHAFQETVAKN